MIKQEQQSLQCLSRAQVLGSIFFATIRLADSISPEIVHQLRLSRQRWLHRFIVRGIAPSEYVPAAQKQLFGQLDDLLDWALRDEGLGRPEFAARMRDRLKRFDGNEYELLAYCVMPNHVHVLFRLEETSVVIPNLELGEQPDDVSPLASLLRLWKHDEDTASDLSWHPASFVHEVRDVEDLHRLIDYVAYNPIKAGLSGQIHEWPWCSAHDRFQRDGLETAWLPSDLS